MDIPPSYLAGDAIIIEADLTEKSPPFGPAQPSQVAVAIYDSFNNLVITGTMLQNGPAGTYIYIFQSSSKSTPGSWTYIVATTNADTTQNVSLRGTFIIDSPSVIPPA